MDKLYLVKFGDLTHDLESKMFYFNLFKNKEGEEDVTITSRCRVQKTLLNKNLNSIEYKVKIHVVS